MLCAERFDRNNLTLDTPESGVGMLVVIDPSVADYQMLAAGVLPGAETIVLEPHRDAIAQITMALTRHREYQSLHIVCHGEPGSLYLGKTCLSAPNLAPYRQQLLEWGVAEILLYSCEVAAGKVGTAFVEQLSRLTGADIAASASLVGNGALGGSWHLESYCGEVSAGLAFVPEVVREYSGVFFDFNLVGFTQAGYQVNEDGTVVGVPVTVERIGIIGNASSIDVQLIDGSATGEVDFNSTTIPITFAPGETNATVTIPIFDDEFVEETENLTLQLANGSPGTILGFQSSAALDILDNDSNSPIVDLEALGFAFLDEPLEVQPGVALIAAGPSPQELRLRTTFNEDAADTTNADDLWSGGSLGLNLTGSGVTVGVWDSGKVRNTHQEFGNRVTIEDAGASFSNHSTHVAGTIGAAGVDPAARGMANQADIVSYDWHNDVTEMNAAASSIHLSNHSYGNIAGWTIKPMNWGGAVGRRDEFWVDDRSKGTEDEDFGKYNSDTQALDNVLYNNSNLLSVWAAGNDRDNEFTNMDDDEQYIAALSIPTPPGTIPSGMQGWFLIDSQNSAFPAPGRDGGGTGYDSLPPDQVAKNNLVVGAIDDITVDPYNSSHVNITTFSGWGPTDDGRIKPDVVANGVDLYSPVAASDNAYATYPGTSMAAPNVTGTAALLYEHYDNLFGATPRSATMKGLLIHTAQDAGNVGPDYEYGWGVVDGAAAANFLTDFKDPSASTYLQESTYTGSPTTLEVIPNRSEPLKVTIVWTDPAGTPHGDGLDENTPVLVNDLDLSVTAPNGTVYYPWTVDPGNPSAPAVRNRANHLDNVEQVLIDPGAMQAGTYTINIDRTGSSFTQDYSILVSGVTENNPPQLATPIRTQGLKLQQSGTPNVLEFTFGVNTFTDPDPGDNLTYTAYWLKGVSGYQKRYVGGNWDPVVPDDKWTQRIPLSNATLASHGIGFNPNTRTFSAKNGGFYWIEVVAEDKFGATDVTFADFRAKEGRTVDGYIAGTTVFLDANKNGVLDAGEPFSYSDENGNFNLEFSILDFDTNQNGVLDPEEGNILGIGGVDTAHGLPLSTPITATPGATIVTLLSSLVADFADQGLTVEEANGKVTTALSIPSDVDINHLDPILATNNDEPGGLETFAGMVQVQNFITQTMGLISGASALSNEEIVKEVVAAITSEIQSNITLDLTDASQLEAIILDAGSRTNVDLSQIAAQAALVMAAANQRIADIAANTPIDLIETEFAKVQKIALGETTADLKELAAGTKTIAEVVAENTGAALDDQIDNAQVQSAAPTDLELSDNTVAENQPIGTEVGTFSTIDPDAGETHSYSLVPGEGDTDNDSFEIVNNSLRTSETFDYETQDAYNIRVQTTDGNGGVYWEQFTINVSDAEETPPGNEITGSTGGSRDVLTGTDEDDIITGLRGRDILTGGAGSDQFVYTSLVDAGDIITDFEVGVDKIVMGQVLDSLGYDGTDPIADGYISVGSRRGDDTIIRIDADGIAGPGRARSFILVEDVSVDDLNHPNNFAW